MVITSRLHGGIGMKMKYYITMIIVLVAGQISVTNAGAASINAATCSQADVQAALNTAVDGDIVFVPAGSCTWNSVVALINKNIIIKGAGVGQTIISLNSSNGAFFVDNRSKSDFRISGFTFNGSPTNPSTYVVRINSNSNNDPVSGWRVDHCSFDFGNNNVHGIGIQGINYGVIDHCTFSGIGYVAIQLYSFLNSEYSHGGTTYGDKAWSLPLNLGTDEAVYVEDCIFNFEDGNAGNVYDTHYGGRIVFRYNIVNRATIVTHATRKSDRGGLKHEIYNNVWSGMPGGYPEPGLIRSGTGVLFNNTVTGYDNPDFSVDNQRTCIVYVGRFDRCNGSNPYDGNTSGEFGWPCIDQIGRGSGVPVGSLQPSVPFYGWNNGSDSTCSTGGLCNNSSQIVVNNDFELCLTGSPITLNTHIKTISDPIPHAGGIVDYINNGSTPKPGYTPFEYPHPLTYPDPPLNLN